jgi:NAD(P)H-flavin reductase
MPIAREFECRVTETLWLTPTVLRIRFEPAKAFKFDPGQFLSLMVPKPFAPPGGPARLRRIYSFAAPAEKGYELCIKQTNGPGPRYLSSLKKGDRFKASAPYGDFVYEPREGRSACFISTGTGIAPFRAIALSRAFQENPPVKAYSLFGARTPDEILYRGEFEAAGVGEIHCVSQPPEGWNGFQGRVTDYLRSLVAEVRRLLRDVRGVPSSAIHQEVYFAPPASQGPATKPPAAANAAAEPARRVSSG